MTQQLCKQTKSPFNPHTHIHNTWACTDKKNETYLWLDLQGSIFGPSPIAKVFSKNKTVTEIKDVATWGAEWHAGAGGYREGGRGAGMCATWRDQAGQWLTFHQGQYNISLKYLVLCCFWMLFSLFFYVFLWEDLLIIAANGWYRWKQMV